MRPAVGYKSIGRTMLFLLSLTCATSKFLLAQNVGIGTNTPQVKLDVKGGFRTGGASNFLLYDSADGKITWSNSNLFLPNPQYIIRHSASSEGLYYASGRLEYRNSAGTPTFFTNWTNGNGYFQNNLGIGHPNPAIPLSFAPILGDKISLWGDAASYGFGIQQYLLQIHTDASFSDIAFGYGTSAAFQENMRITGTGVLRMARLQGKRIVLYPSDYGDASLSIVNGALRIASEFGNPELSFGMDDNTYGYDERMRLNYLGYLGLGVSDPNYRLDVDGRMRIRSGGSNSVSAGLWLNNNSNTEAAFIGMENDSYVGFFGNSGGGGWKFSMNTQNGALRINGTEGQAGQTLKSNGANQAPTWTNPMNALYNNMIELNQTSNVTTGPLNVNNLPGISNYALVITTRSKVIFSSSTQMKSNNCLGCGGSTISYGVQVSFPNGAGMDGGSGDTNLGVDEERTCVSGMKMYTLNPGTYTINVYIRNENLSGPSITASAGRLNIIVIQE